MPIPPADNRIIGRSAFARWGRFVHRHKWWIVAAWLLLLVGLGPQAAQFQDRLSNGGFEVPGSDSSAVSNAIKKEFPGQRVFADLLVLRSQEVDARSPEFRRVFQEVRSNLMAAPGVAAVADPYSTPESSIARDGKTVIAQVKLDDNQDQALEHAPALQAAVNKAANGSGVRALLAGSAPYYNAMQETTTQDLTRAETFALPITLLILLLAFGSAVAAGVPLVTAGLALGAAFGVVSIIASFYGVSIFTENMASMIGLGVGIDYALFLVSRFRERLRAGSTREVALAETMATTGKTVFVSAMTVAVALSGTIIVNIQAFRSMGIGAMIAVILAGLSSLTLLPALLAILGPRIDSFSLRRRTSATTGGFWHTWSLWIMGHPWGPLLVGFAILVLLAFPAHSLQMGSSGVAILPKDAGPRIAVEEITRSFGQGQSDPLQVIVTTPQAVTRQGFPAVYKVVQRISRMDEVSHVTSIATIKPRMSQAEEGVIVSSPQAKRLIAPLVSEDGRSTVVTVATVHDPQSAQTGDLTKRIRATFAAGGPEGSTVLVGGAGANNVDLNDELRQVLPLVIAFVLLLSYLILLLYVRSVFLPLKAILLNLGSVLASYGLITFIFQEGHFSSLLSFTPQGFIESFMPVFLFSVLFGLSMDYEIFILSRIREQYLKTGDNALAVARGLESSGRIITSAAAVMVTVFGGFAAASLVPIKSMGFGLAAAVLIDATLIRVVLVPALMRLMGRWNWWAPKWLDDLLARVSLAEQQLDEPLPVTRPHPELEPA